MMYFALISVQTSTSESQLEHSTVCMVHKKMQGIKVGTEARVKNLYR